MLFVHQGTGQLILQEVARTGGAAPGTTHQFKVFVNSPTISSSGHVAFFANVTNAVDTGFNVFGLWRTVGTNPVLVAWTGMDAPGTPTGVSFKMLPALTGVVPQPLISDQGLTLFNASLQGSGVVSSNSSGVWWDGAGSLKLMLRRGVPGAGLGVNSEVVSIGEMGINSNGLAFGVAEYHEFPGGNLTTNVGLWLGDVGGPMLVVKTGDNAPGTVLPAQFIGFRYDPVGGIFDQEGKFHFGAVAGDPFDPGAPNHYSGVWSINDSATVEKAVIPPFAIENTTLDLTDMTRFALNRKRRFALTGDVNGGPPNSVAIVSGTNDVLNNPHFTLTTLTDGPVPGRPVGWTFTSLAQGPLFVSDWDRTIWVGAASTPGAAQSWGIWSKGLSNDYAKIVMEGDSAPAFGAGAYFKTIFQNNYITAIRPPTFIANHWGQIGFICEVAGGSAGSGTRMIWAMNRYGQLVPVARVGQSLKVGGVFRTVTGLELGGGFSDNGELVFRAICSGGIEAVFKANLGQLLPGADRQNVVFMEYDLPYSGEASDPVNTFTGGFSITEQPDLSMSGPMPFSFERYYSSSFVRTGQSNNICGLNWRHNFEYSLYTAVDHAIVTDPHGRQIRFVQTNNNWSLEKTNDTPYQLSESAGQFYFGDPAEDTAYTFDTNGQLIAISDTHGAGLILTYTNGLLGRVSDGLGRSFDFEYNGGKLASLTDGARTVAFGYSGDNLETVTNPLLNVTTYTYDPTNQYGGLLTSITRPRGNVALEQQYDPFGRVQNQTLRETNQTQFEYGGLITTIRNPLNATRSHLHSPSGELLSVTDERGKVIGMKYDPLGRRVAVTNQLGEVTQLSFHESSGKYASMTEPDGMQLSYDYQPRSFGNLVFHDLTQRTFADGSSETFSRDALGRITTIKTRDGTLLHYGVNNHGQLLASTNALGAATHYSYNPDGTLSSISDAAGSVVAYGYDALRRMTSITNADLTVRRYAYDALDHIVEAVDERGLTNTFAYDGNGNLAQAVDALGNTTSYAYDALDQLTAITDPRGGIYTYEYDELGRPYRETDQNTNTVEFEYDLAGRLVTVIDPQGEYRNRGYDDAGRLTYADTPSGTFFTHEYDVRGRLTSTHSPSDFVSQFGYDSFDQLKEYVDPLGGMTQYLYDSNSLLAKLTMPGNVIKSSYVRNEMGLITAIKDPNDNAWLRSYDALGQLLTMSDPLGNTATNTFDARHRLQKVSWPIGSLQITRDAAGNITRRLFSDGTDLTYAYDVDNRPTNATGVTFAYAANGEVTNCNGLAMTHDPAGRLTSLTLAPGKTVQYAYDARDLVTNVTDWVGGSTTLQYDEDGRLIQMIRPNGIVTTYGYDDESRLATLQESFGTNISLISLARDGVGRVTNTLRELPLSTPFVLTNRLHSFDAADQVVGFQYDAMGRLLNDGTRGYQWNLDSRLTGYTNGLQTIVFSYDGYGYLISRVQGTVTNQFVWNHAFELPSICVQKNAGSDARYYIHTPDGLLLHSIDAATGSREFYHYDETGNTLFLTDDDATIVHRYAYGSYGELLASVGSSDNTFTWLGRYGVRQEGNTGLYYIRQRYYDSGTSRFISREPLPADNHPLTISPYQYAFGDPGQFCDVTGFAPEANSSSEPSAHPKWDEGVKSVLKTLSTAKKIAENVIGGRQVQIPFNGRKLTVGLEAVSKSRADALLEAARSGKMPRTPEKLLEYVKLRKVEQVAGGVSRTVKTAGDIGSYVNSGLTTIDGFASAHEKVREFSRNLDSINETQARQLAGVESLLNEHKLISRARAEFFFKQIVRNAEESRAAAYQSARYGIWADAYITEKNLAIERLLPDPVQKVMGVVLPADPQNY